MLRKRWLQRQWLASQPCFPQFVFMNRSNAIISLFGLSKRWHTCELSKSNLGKFNIARGRDEKVDEIFRLLFSICWSDSFCWASKWLGGLWSSWTSTILWRTPIVGRKAMALFRAFISMVVSINMSTYKTMAMKMIQMSMQDDYPMNWDYLTYPVVVELCRRKFNAKGQLCAADFLERATEENADLVMRRTSLTAVGNIGIVRE